jgi:hypothetical protein
MSDKNNSHNIHDEVTHKELVFAISKIFSIEVEKVLDNIELFSSINPYVKNIFHYLSQMDRDVMLIDASHSMEFLLNFHCKATD